jgi:glutaredoxin
MKPQRVRLFVKTWCPWCREAEAWLKARGVAYERLDVHADPRHFEEMRRLSGQSLAPVIEADGRVLADFGADELGAWWQAQEWGR